MAASTCKCLRWAFRFSDWEPVGSEWLLILRSIQAEEVARIMRFRFREDAKSAAVGRLMLRASVSKMLNVPWSQIRLGRSEKGKPILENPNIPHCCPSFNVSHQGDYVVLASDCGPYCGVDTMKVEFRQSALDKTVDEYVGSFRRQFSATERSTMERAQSEKEKLTLFFRYWCLKESYVKAIGIGIHNDLAALDFRCDVDNGTPRKPILWLGGKPASDQWRFFEYELGSDHVAAVCTAATPEVNCRRRTEENLPFETISIRDLLERAEPVCTVDDGLYEQYAAKPYKKK